MPAEAASDTLERPKVYWEDETMFAENKEPGCATYIPYITEKEMLADKDFIVHHGCIARVLRLNC